MNVRPILAARLKLLPFWLAGNGGWLGVLLGGFFLLALMGAVWLIFSPRYPAEDITGQITGLGFVEVEGRGSVSTASIQVHGDPVWIELPSRHNCRVGDLVQLRRLELRWGYSYRVAISRWPCSPAPSTH